MWQHFTLRRWRSRRFPNVITGGTPDNGSAQDKLTWLKVLIAYTPILPKDLANEEKWPLLPDGISRKHAGQTVDEVLRKKISLEAVEEWTTKELVEKSAAQILAKYKAHPGRYREIRIVFPFPAEKSATKNYIPLDFAKRLEIEIKSYGLSTAVIIETNPSNPDPENGTYIFGKGSRGLPKVPDIDNDKQRRYHYAIQRIARQVLVGGVVEKRALYWLIDDGITAGGTIANYYTHICENGGSVGAITTLSKRFMGNEVLAVQRESIEFLEFAIWKMVRNRSKRSRERLADDLRLGKVWIHEAIPEHYDRDHDKAFPHGKLHSLKDMVQSRLMSLGVFLSYTEKWPPPHNSYYGRERWAAKTYHPWQRETTMTNQEILLLGAYFMHPSDAESWIMLNRALRRIGTSVDQSCDSYVVRVAGLAAGTGKEFQQLVDHALVTREYYLDERTKKQFKGRSHSATFAEQHFVHGVNGWSSGGRWDEYEHY